MKLLKVRFLISWQSLNQTRIWAESKFGQLPLEGLTSPHCDPSDISRRFVFINPWIKGFNCLQYNKK